MGVSVRVSSNQHGRLTMEALKIYDQVFLISESQEKFVQDRYEWLIVWCMFSILEPKYFWFQDQCE